MTYTITDITELVRYHLVLSVPDDETADNNLRRLVHEIEGLATTPLWRPVEWMACEACGAWVDTDLIGPDGAGDAADGGFYCSSCRWGQEE
jgi:hypothetical protein